MAAAVVRYAHSQYLVRVATLMCLQWGSLIFLLLKSAVDCHMEALSTSPVWMVVQLVLGASIIIYFTRFVSARLFVMEQAMLQPLGSKLVRLITNSLAGNALLFILLNLPSPVPMQLRIIGLQVLFWHTTLGLFAVLVLSLFPIARVARLVATAYRQARQSPELGAVIPELRKSRKALNHLLIGMAQASITVQLNLLMVGLLNNLHWHGTRTAWSLAAWQVSFVMDRITTSVSCALFSGVLGGSLFASRDQWLIELRRKAKLRQSMKTFLPCSDAGWHQKVEELAGRGFTMRALLGFYKRLGTAEVMPHYDSTRSTTLDVVRQAVIPLSSEAKSSLASVMMEGKVVRPQMMVTHNWGNLFRDLVACIIADALGEDEYYMAAYWLDHEMDLVEEWLSTAGAMDNTYWVCAFSIAQHAGICGGNPACERDSVTGQLHPVCDCGQPKCFNTTEPLSADGQSISCEMNKFDNMLEFLGASNKRFRHVIAVDRKFTLFSRAWCVAEIAKAFDFGIEQHLLLPSAALLTEHEASLLDLRVEDMKATRPEDAQAILAKIPDKAAFNQQLQHLIHDRLLVTWKSLDEGQRLQRAGRIARLQLACQQRKVGLAPWYAGFSSTGGEFINSECSL